MDDDYIYLYLCQFCLVGQSLKHQLRTFYSLYVNLESRCFHVDNPVQRPGKLCKSDYNETKTEDWIYGDIP